MSDIIPEIMNNFGLWGVFLLMLIEVVFPPIPSEVIMPLAGMYAAQQKFSLLGVVVSGALGALAGNIVWFAVAWALGLDRFERFLVRYGRLFTLDEDEIARGRRLFDKYGGSIVGFGRVIPAVRSLISVPAGLVRMRVSTFLVYTSIGTFVWTIGLAIAGYFLGARFEEVDKIMAPLSTLVLAICLVIYFYRVIMWKRWQKAKGRA